jgi:hypothetical protein
MTIDAHREGLKMTHTMLREVLQKGEIRSGSVTITLDDFKAKKILQDAFRPALEDKTGEQNDNEQRS